MQYRPLPAILALTLTIGGCAVPGASAEGPDTGSFAREADAELAFDDKAYAEEDVCSECSPGPIDRDPSLIVRDPEILERFKLRRVLRQLTGMAGSATNEDALWKQWWASQRERTAGDPAHHSFCSDDHQTINGFRIECPREESLLEFERLDTHTPVALVNRFDLAPMDGAHCGEYRIVYALDGQIIPAHPADQVEVQDGRNFIIFEGVLPNPDPECGLAACQPVAEMWQNLTEQPVDEQAVTLDKFFFEGYCEFEPVVKPEHYGLDCRGGDGYGGECGQIRTNQFIQRNWNLREYQLVFDHGELLVDQVTVKANPHTTLFDGTADPSRVADFANDYPTNLASLLPSPDGINFVSLQTAGKFDAGESLAEPSPVGFPENDYHTLTGSTLHTNTVGELNSIYGGAPPIGIGETDTRATTQSCGGCHRITDGAPIGTSETGGTGLTWPPALGFVHIDESGNLSPALTDPGMFLDHRKQVLAEFLEVTCGTECLGPNSSGILVQPPVDQTEPGDPRPLVQFEIVGKDEFRAFFDFDGFSDATLSGHRTH